MHAIEVCRTAALGGHKDKCDSCGHMEISYNSCRNRRCPKCQTLRKEKRKDVQDGAAAPLSMQQPTIVVQMRPMSNVKTKYPDSCEKYILFRHGFLLPKITYSSISRPLADLSVKRLSPAIGQRQHKKTNQAPYSPVC
jgi:hypothetical protein